MNRREIFKGLAFVIAGGVAADAVRGETPPDPLNQRGPRDTDDEKYDAMLDEMLGEEWS